MKKIFILIAVLLSSNLYSADWSRVSTLIKENQYSSALSYISKVKNKDAQYHWYRGLVLELMNRYKESAREYKSASKLNTKKNFYQHYARVLMKGGEFKESLKVIKKGRNKYPSSKRLYSLNKQVVNLLNAKYKKSLLKIQKAFENGDFKTSLSESRKTLSVFKNDFVILLYKAYSEIYLVNFKQALRDFKRLRKAHPKNLSVLKGHYNLSIKMGNKKDAKGLLKSIGAQSGDTAQEHLELGVLYISSGDNKAARAEFEKSLTLNPQSAEAYEYLGYIDLIENNLNRSIKEYKKSLSLRSNLPEAYLALDQIYSGRSQEEQAVKIINAGLVWSPDNTDLLIRAGMHAEIAGNKKKAKAYYSKALKVHPDSAAAKEGIERIELSLKSEVYLEYGIQEINDDGRNPFILDLGNYKKKTAKVRLGTYVTTSTWLGLEFVNDEHKKSSLPNHKVTSDTFTLGLTWAKEKVLLNTSLGLSNLDGNDVSSGFKGEDKKVNFSVLGSYALAAHNLSVSFAKSTYVYDSGPGLNLENLLTVTLQDQWAICDSWSLLGRYTRGDSDNLNYDVYTISPTYQFSFLRGLSSYVQLDLIDEEVSDAYFNESLGLNYDNFWTDKLSTSFSTALENRHSDDEMYSTSSFLLRYFFMPTVEGDFSLNYEHNLGDLKSKTLGGMVSLRLLF